jgi:catalase (peroxidase I)
MIKGSATLPPDIMMFTTDIALRNDSDYLLISQLYKNDTKVLENQFKHAWYKVTTRDSGKRF